MSEYGRVIESDERWLVIMRTCKDHGLFAECHKEEVYLWWYIVTGCCLMKVSKLSALRSGKCVGGRSQNVFRWLELLSGNENVV